MGYLFENERYNCLASQNICSEEDFYCNTISKLWEFYNDNLKLCESQFLSYYNLAFRT